MNMKLQNELAPSILAADLGNLKKDMLDTREGDALYAHIDVMDGHFVPEISFGEGIVRSIRPFTDQILDVHLMVTNPEMHLEPFAKAGADSITFHYEVMPGGNTEYPNAYYASDFDFEGKTAEDAAAAAKEMIDRIHALGCEAGISIKPKTPVEVLFPILKDLDLVLVMTVEPGFGGQKLIPGSTDRIRKLRAEAEKVNPSLKIEVDGGVKLDNVKEILDSGANLIVAGSAVYGKDTLGQTKAFMQILKA
jgi:ribulose-phosphate 3-epimerase